MNLRTGRASLLVTVPLLLGACQAQGAQFDVVVPPRTVDTLAVLDGDTVLLRGAPDVNELVWIGGSGRARGVWSSGSLLYARPTVTLAYMDGDQSPDLFFTLHYEELIAGGLILGGPGEAKRVFRSSDSACRPPELRDVTGDGRPEILDFESGALMSEECSGDYYAQQCMEAFPTEWVSVLSVMQDGSVVRDPRDARDFFAAQSVAYRDGANRLRASLRSGEPGLPERCDESMAVVLEGMAIRARIMSGRR